MTTHTFIEKKGLKMLEITPINTTGIAEAYTTVRSAKGYSTGSFGTFSCNIYKEFGLENGIKDFELFCHSIDIDPKTVVTNRLTAFTNIVRKVDENDIINIYDEALAPRADGLITNSKQITLYNYQADCSIIHLLDIENRAIGSLHASWKGSLNGIIQNTVEAMIDAYGTNPQNIIAVINPTIAGCCFEVGEEVANKFLEQGFRSFILTEYIKPHIDLFGVNRKILQSCNIPNENIYTVDLCTHCNSDLFHSYRRGPIDENGKHLNGMNGCFIRLK